MSIDLIVLFASWGFSVAEATVVIGRSCQSAHTIGWLGTVDFFLPFVDDGNPTLRCNFLMVGALLLVAKITLLAVYSSWQRLSSCLYFRGACLLIPIKSTSLHSMKGLEVRQVVLHLQCAQLYGISTHHSRALLLDMSSPSVSLII